MITAWAVSTVIAHGLGSTSVEATIAQVAGGVVAGFLAFLATALIVRIQEVDDVRAMIAKRMRASLQEMAQLTLTMDADMTAVLADRAERKTAETAVPSITDYVVAAAARALLRALAIGCVIS